MSAYGLHDPRAPRVRPGGLTPGPHKSAPPHPSVRESGRGIEPPLAAAAGFFRCGRATAQEIGGQRRPWPARSEEGGVVMLVETECPPSDREELGVRGRPEGAA